MNESKQIDESWKDAVASEKEESNQESVKKPDISGDGEGSGDEMQINFLNYISSLVFQTMIFLGIIPNPISDNKIDKDAKQAKFLIDTLIMIREKTKGNLSDEEYKLLDNSIYELQMRYVEELKQSRGEIS